MGLGAAVWERTGGVDTMSKRSYVAAITLFTMFGLVLASFVAYQAMIWHLTNPWIFLGVGLGLPFIGILMTLWSNKWLISLVGYILVVIGVGVIIGPTIAIFKTAVIFNALLATAGVTILMSIAGIIYPGTLESWGGYLFGGLSALLFVRIGQILLGGIGIQENAWYMSWIEYGAAVLFSLYIMFDWNRALMLAHTLDNAVDASVAIFLDIANLFIIVLGIFSKREEENS